MSSHSPLYGALQVLQAFSMGAARRVPFAVFRQRDRAAPLRRGLGGEIALVEREQAKRMEHPGRPRSLVRPYLRLECVKRDRDVGCGLRVRPILACPAQPRHVHAAGQTHGFEHPLIAGSHHASTATSPFPRLGNEPPGNSALLLRGIHFQQEGGRTLRFLLRNVLVIGPVPAGVDAAQCPGDSQAIPRPKGVNVE